MNTLITRDTGFSDVAVLRQTGDVDWRTENHEITYTALDGDRFTIPVGFGTDLASTPRVTAWLAPRSGRFLLAVLLHDYLYRVLCAVELMSYSRADFLLREASRRCGVPPMLRLAMWAAVRWSALTRGRAAVRGLLVDLVPVVLVTIPALLVVTIPAALVAVALIVWWGYELVAVAVQWVAQRLGWIPADRYLNRPIDLTRV